MLINSKILNLFSETPLKKLTYKNFIKLWVKDESVNPTGTHKDRLAYGIIKLYKHHARFSQGSKPPVCSIISTGNAALAIAKLFQEYSLPPLKALLDNSINKISINFLRASYCEVYLADIMSKQLSSSDILSMTENEDGIDLTSIGLFDTCNKHYAALVKNVLSVKPDVILIPYGSGILFENFCSVVQILFDYKFKTAPSLIGVTTQNKISKADKLYSAYSPFDFNRERLHFMIKFGLLGKESKIANIGEASLEEAVVVLRENGIQAEYSGASGLAYIIENSEILSPNASYVIINTGKGLLSQ